VSGDADPNDVMAEERTNYVDGVSSYNWNTHYRWHDTNDPMKTTIHFDVRDDDDGSSENLGRGSIRMSDLHTDVDEVCKTESSEYITSNSGSCWSSWQSDDAGLLEGTISYKYRWRPYWKGSDGPWSDHPDIPKYINTEEAGVENPKGDWPTQDAS
jgi:hypothetical protein